MLAYVGLPTHKKCGPYEVKQGPKVKLCYFTRHNTERLAKKVPIILVHLRKQTCVKNVKI